MIEGPLHGVRVLEIAGIGPGPFCGMLLADLGADVVRVDRPGERGLMSQVPSDRDLLNRGKRSVAVDLRDPAGVERVLDLVEAADILFEGYRPGVAERLGIGPEPCLARNPRLVYGRITGWGQVGPLAHTAGHDISYIAPTGALHALGPADGAPQAPLNLLGDFAGGSMYLAVGLLAAFVEARSSGRGQVVDAAMVDGAAHLMTPFYGLLDAGLWQDRRGVNVLDGGAPFYGVYETSDGEHMAVGALEPQFFAEFVRLLGVPEAAGQQADGRAWPQLRKQVGEAFASRTQAEWIAVFSGTDACVAPVLSMKNAPNTRTSSPARRSSDTTEQPNPGRPRDSREPPGASAALRPPPDSTTTKCSPIG